MRDIKRIPEILKELGKVWLENPDLRLGQIITVATRSSTLLKFLFKSIR